MQARSFFIAVFLAIASACFFQSAVADETAALWTPDGVDGAPSSVSVADVLSTYVKLHRPEASFLESYTLRAGTTQLQFTAATSGSDYRVETTVAGARYAMGRSGTKRWRETPAGTVRVIESDVQGDDFDRWPEAVFGFDPASCAVGGQTASDWALHCKPDGDSLHWFFVSKSTGYIEREISREGSRIVTYAFDTFAPSAAGVIAHHWVMIGSGGDADVTLDSITPADLPKLAVPSSDPEIFKLPPGIQQVHVAAGFGRFGRITIPLTVNGHTLKVDLDTGTTQMLMDVGEAARIGLQSTLDHAMAGSVRIGDLTAQTLPFETVDLFGGKLSAIVGDEFFQGHIVHIDYGHSSVDVIARLHFTPPSDAYQVAVNCDEGMPLVGMAIGRTVRNRVALDTGSFTLVLGPSYFTGNDAAVFRPAFGRGQYMNFLEGPLLVERGDMTSPSIGPFTIADVPANVAIPAQNSLDIPLDGIIGTDVLQHFEFWFDYDTNRLWMRPTGS